MLYSNDTTAYCDTREHAIGVVARGFMTFFEAVKEAIGAVLAAYDDLEEGVDVAEFLTLLQGVLVAVANVGAVYTNLSPARRKHQTLVAIRIAVKNAKVDIPGVPTFLEMVVIHFILRDVLPILYDTLVKE
jgi:hypothetical protein